jgi:nucleoside-diphosphate-sugar epimerase/predicted dehydrogenase
MASQSSPLRVALVGAGNIADWYAKALRGVPGARLVAVCDLSRSRAESFAKRYRVPAAFGSYAELHREAKPQVAHILTPPEHHFAAAREVIESGVHALLEKPMCTTVDECDALIALAEARGVLVGTSHNFTHAPVYDRLRRDLHAGILGRLDTVSIVWNKEYPPASKGPYSLWALQRPENILLEIGPHIVAHLLDLLGDPEHLHVEPGLPLELPTGVTFYRRWLVAATRGDAAAQVTINLGPGFTEHSVHVRGSLAAATADFERNTYVLERHTPNGYDVDRFARVHAEGKQLARQAWGNLWRAVASKATKSPKGQPFGASLADSVAAFYADVERAKHQAAKVDVRNSARRARDVVYWCHRIGSALSTDSNSAQEPRVVRPATDNGQRTTEQKPKILILGATGFIGRTLVESLTDQGRAVRVLVRRPGGVDLTFDRRLVEVMRGDTASAEDMERALDGITRVCHLARAQASTYEEYLRNDVEVTRRIAEQCLAHKVERLVYASSIAIYYAGKHAGTIDEATPPDRAVGLAAPYARSKAEAEAMLLKMHREQGLPVVIARPGVVIGPGGTPYHPGVGHWSWDAICRYWGSGTTPLPLVLVDDVATGLVAALDRPGIDGQACNLVGEPLLSAREYVAALEAAESVRFDTKPKSILSFYLTDLAKWVVKVLVRHPNRNRPSYRYWESRSQRARYDCSRTKQLLDWHPVADREELILRGILSVVRGPSSVAGTGRESTAVGGNGEARHATDHGQRTTDKS